MGVVQDEYRRFLRWLAASNATPDARRVANVVLRHLETVVATVNNGGQRTNLLAPYLRRQLEEAPDAIEVDDQAATVAPLGWTKLKSLRLGPFRGFRREEQFDLSRNIVLFQGPNGSGKSSLCEAIELALLGEVEEAAVKRIDNAADYFDNIHERSHARPELIAHSDAGDVVVTPNSELLRFAIIEKNRIESFARLAARTPAQAGPLIGSLLGLDAFNSFVGNFGQNLDNRLDFRTPKNTELTAKNVELNASRATVGGWPQAQQRFDQEQEALAVAYEEGLTFAQLLERLGLHGAEGRLQQLRAEIREAIPAQVGLAVAQFSQLRREIRASRSALHACQQQLDQRAGEVNFRALYNDVRALQAQHPDECPACLTPLDQVAEDPYARATQGLELLQDLAALQEERSRHQRAIEQSIARLKDKVGAALGDLGEASEALEAWRAWHAGPAQAERTPSKQEWSELLDLVKRIEAVDRTNRRRQEGREPAAREVEALEQVKDLVDAIRLRRSEAGRVVTAEQAKIDAFQEANAELIAAEAEEQLAVALDRRIQAAYADFREALLAYRDSLPAGLLAHLNETTKELYNSFNADDHEHDLLASIRLPERGGDRIMIAFAGSAGQGRDALAVLSEGHLRCLGLAILLAKNIHLNLPLMIFDDAVNAIDHDHRRAIRDTLLQDARLRAKQIIITCHSPDFITQFQNDLADGSSTLYVLDHHSGDHHPRVSPGSDRSYLIRAHERLDNSDPRQALASSRQALENTTTKVWRALKNKDAALATFPLVLRGPKSEPELRDFIGKLSAAVAQGVDQGRLTGEKWIARRDAFNDLLKVPESDLAWRYLNKGTHDGETEDPEIGIVRQVVAALDKLTASLP